MPKACATENCEKNATKLSPFCSLCQRVLAKWAERPVAARVARELQLAKWADRMGNLAKKGNVHTLKRGRRA